MSGCQQLNISLVAYDVTGKLVMVKVPNERARWVLTDRCVIEVPCSHCKAIVGEPCATIRHTHTLYTSGVHYVRRKDGKTAYGRGHRWTAPIRGEKFHITAEDFAESQKEPT